MKPESFLGRGMQSISGKPFGYAHNKERDEIRAHLIARGWDATDFAFEFRVTEIQQRIHRYAPTMRQRQEAARAKTIVQPSLEFTPEELQHIADHFCGANDPLAQSIYRKASRT